MHYVLHTTFKVWPFQVALVCSHIWNISSLHFEVFLVTVILTGCLQEMLHPITVLIDPSVQSVSSCPTTWYSWFKVRLSVNDERPPWLRDASTATSAEGPLNLQRSRWSPLWPKCHLFEKEDWTIYWIGPFFSTEDISTRHSRKSTGVNNKMNDGWIPFSCSSFRVLVLCMPAHCRTVTAYWIELSHR